MRIARHLLPCLLLALGACSGGGGDEAPVDAAPDAQFGCFSTEGGADMGLTVGYLNEDEFVELADGDDTILLAGVQGLYMLHLEARAMLDLDGDSVCLTCTTEVSESESGTYPGAEGPPTITAFSRLAPGEFTSFYNTILGSVEAPEPFADAIVDVSMECMGHGFSGSVERLDLKLTLPPE